MHWFRTISASLWMFLIITPVAVSKSVQVYPLEQVSVAIPSDKDGQLAFFFKALSPGVDAYSEYSLQIQYLPGKGGGIALNSLLLAKPNGYALAAFTAPAYFLQHMAPDSQYAKEEYTSVALLASYPLALWVPEDSPYNSIDAFLQAMRQQPKGSVYIGGLGRFGAHHMLTVLLGHSSGVYLVYMPLLGTTQTLDAVKQSRAIAVWGAGMVKETMPGMRPLALTGTQRSLVFPQVPIFAESGLPLHLVEYAGIAVRQDVSVAMQNRIAHFFKNILAAPTVASNLVQLGITPHFLEGDELTTFLLSGEQAAEAFMEEFRFFLE